MWIKVAALFIGSFALHLAFFAGVEVIVRTRGERPMQPIKVKIVQKEEPPPAPQVLPKKDIPEKPKLAQPRTPKKPVPEKPKEVQGLSAESLSKDPAAILAAPAGNSLMRKDEGIRLSPEDIAALKKDLSSDAILIQGSFVIPEYTQPALDANLEGKFTVDVFVDEQGRVVSAELRQKIGYGMDARVVEVARSARFIARKDAKGVPLAGWAEIKFYLEIP